MALTDPAQQFIMRLLMGDLPLETFSTAPETEEEEQQMLDHGGPEEMPSMRSRDDYIKSILQRDQRERDRYRR